MYPYVVCIWVHCVPFSWPRCWRLSLWIKSCISVWNVQVMEMAIRSNPFHTRYFCWLDIGLFRDLSGAGVNGSRFTLSLPPNFDAGSVAYTQVARRLSNLSVEEIISRNMYWVCGCFFVGRVDVLRQLIDEYKVRRYFAQVVQQMLQKTCNNLRRFRKILCKKMGGEYMLVISAVARVT